MGAGELVKLKGRTEALEALACGLTHVGPSKGAPEWLVSAVWLWVVDKQYVATASAEVLADGFVARRLCISPAEDLARHLEAELPDLRARLLARGNGMDLPPAEVLEPPESLITWPCKSYATHVLIRVAQRAAQIHRVTCGLLFTSDDRSLLVGTDPSILAMVLSEDPELIGHYCADCEALSPADYLRLCG